MIFFLMLFLTSFVLQAQDTNVIDNLNLQNVNGSSQGNIYLGGRTIDGNNGMRLFGGGQYNGFIDVVSNSSTDGLRFRVDQSDGSEERMRITANGRVGINNSSPDQALHVKGKIRASNTGNASEYVEIYHGGSHGFINTAGDGNLDFRHDNFTLMSLTDGGKLGIGTKTPLGKLHVTGLNPNIRIASDQGGTLELGSADCDGCYSSFAQPGDGVMRMSSGSQNIIFNTSSISNIGRTFKFATEEDVLMQIADDGKVSIGTTNPSLFKLYVAGSAFATGSWISSDKRYKENIKTIDSALDKINELDGVSYKFKQKTVNGIDFSQLKQSNQLGFIAQDIEEVFPELVQKDEAGYYAVNYDGLIPVLVEGMKEQQEIITEQEQEIDDMKARIERLESLLNKPNNINDNGFNIQENTDFSNVVLKQNAPNPFSNETTIAYELPTNLNTARLVIYDLNGKVISTYNVTGKGSVKFDTDQLSNGTYIYAVVANGKSIATQKMVIQK